MNNVTVSIIGAGTGGYVAAIRAAQLGAEVNLIEKENIGGTCLNWGCIPTKALVYSSERYSEMQNGRRYGVECSDINLNMQKVIKNKDKIVKQLVGGVKFLLDKNNVNLYKGTANLLDKNNIAVKTANKTVKINTDYIILATGSKIKKAPIKGIDMEEILTSKDILDLDELPRSLAIIGGGIIGMEFAFIYSNFGVDVKVVEYLNEILPGIDNEVSSAINKIAERDNIDITTNARVKEVTKNNKQYLIKFIKNNKEKESNVEKVLVATGRKPSFGGLNLEKLKIKTVNNAIKVDNHMKTTVDNIYAVGDVTGKMLLAHVASHQGIVAAENIMGVDKKMSYRNVPSAIFTKPEIATVGLNEEEVRKQYSNYRVGKFPFSANGKVKTMNKKSGFIKIISKESNGEILGASIIGVHATDMIHELTLAMDKNIRIEDIIETIHAHPTTSEVIPEAAMDSLGRALHYVRIS